MQVSNQPFHAFIGNSPNTRSYMECGGIS